jgi:L-threonylcarbamoyladenylate synthase
VINNLVPKLVQQIEKAAAIIRTGGVVAFPTDTVYGLGANPYIKEAVDRIYEVKQRPSGMPLPVLLADELQLADVVVSVPAVARLLIKHFWPGGLTLVLSRKPSFPGSGSAEETKIAVRIPAHEVILAVIRGAGVPVIGTSANISSKPSVLTAREVEVQLGSAVDLIIDGGRCPGGMESTVVDVTGKVPVILRHGAVPDSEIERLCQEYLKGVEKNAHCSRM